MVGEFFRKSRVIFNNHICLDDINIDNISNQGRIQREGLGAPAPPDITFYYDKFNDYSIELIFFI